MKNKKWMAALLSAALAVTSITPFAISESETFVPEVQAAETQTTATSPTDGDVDGLGNGLNVCDMIRMKRYMANRGDTTATIAADNSDVNGDNIIDADDTATLLKALVGGPIKHYWGSESTNVKIGADNSGKRTFTYQNAQTGSTHIYANGQSENVYLSADYTPKTGDKNTIAKMFGIILRGNDGNVRRVGFQNTGIVVMSDYGWKTDGIPDVSSVPKDGIFHYNTANKEHNPYVWAQNAVGYAQTNNQSAINTMITSADTASNVKWLITDGILYASIADVPVLKMELTRLCATWNKDVKYEVALAGYDVNENPFTASNVEVYFGDDALEKVKENKRIASFDVTGNSKHLYYNDMTGTYIPRTYDKDSYGYGKAYTGIQSVNTTVKLFDKSNSASWVGISVRDADGNSAEILTSLKEGAKIQRNHTNDDTKTEITSTVDDTITAMYDANGKCNMTAIIDKNATTSEMKLYLYYNGTLAYQYTLAELLGADKYVSGEAIQLGICTWNASAGLIEFENTRFNTWGDTVDTNTDSERTQFIFDEDGIGVETTVKDKGAFYQYLGDYSDEIYLSADYTTSEINDNWREKEGNGVRYRQFLYGITLRDQDGNSRQVEWHSEGIAVHQGHKWDTEGIPGVAHLRPSTNTDSDTNDGTNDGTNNDSGAETVSETDGETSGGTGEGTDSETSGGTGSQVDNSFYAYNDCWKTSYVWGRREQEGDTYAHSAFGEVATTNTPGTYPTEWLVKEGVLYATFRGEPMLSLPLSELCETWKKGEDGSYPKLQIGFSAWDTSINCLSKMTNIYICYGEDIQDKIIPDNIPFTDNANVVYHPLSGYLTDMVKGATYAYGPEVVGTQGIQARMTLYDMDHASSYAGVTIKSGNQSAQIMVSENELLGGSKENFNIFGNHTKFGDTINNNGVPAYERTHSHDMTYHGYANLVAIIRDERLYVFSNGEQAGSAELYKLLPGYIPETPVQLGFSAWDANLGLASIKETKILTVEEVEEMETDWKVWHFAYVPKDAGNGTYDPLNGTLNKTESFKPLAQQGVAAYVTFTGETDVWEVTGTMKREALENIEDLTMEDWTTDKDKTSKSYTYSKEQIYASQLLQGFKIISGDKALTVVGQHKGVAPVFEYTHNNINSPYVQNESSYRYFAGPEKNNVEVSMRTMDNIAFRLLIVRDTLYVWFNGIPTWKINLAQPITKLDSTEQKFAGFTADSDYSLQLYIGDNIGRGSYENIKVRTGMGVTSIDVSEFQ